MVRSPSGWLNPHNTCLDTNISPGLPLVPNFPPLEASLHPLPHLDPLLFVPRRNGRGLCRRVAIDAVSIVREKVGLAFGYPVGRCGCERLDHRCDTCLLAGSEAGGLGADVCCLGCQEYVF